MRWIQKLYAVMISHLYESSLLRDFLEFLWPRLKTLRLATHLRVQEELDEYKFLALPRARYIRHYFLNSLVVVPFGFYIFLYLFESQKITPNIMHNAALILSIIMIYLVLWDDYREEWRYVSLLTLGTRVSGHIISRDMKVVGNAVDVRVSFLKDPESSIMARVFLAHGIAPNYHGQPGDKVMVAYDKNDVRKCQIVTEETEAFNLRKEKP